MKEGPRGGWFQRVQRNPLNTLYIFSLCVLRPDLRTLRFKRDGTPLLRQPADTRASTMGVYERAGERMDIVA